MDARNVKRNIPIYKISLVENTKETQRENIGDPYNVYEYDDPDDFAEDMWEEFDDSYEDGYDEAFSFYSFSDILRMKRYDGGIMKEYTKVEKILLEIPESFHIMSKEEFREIGKEKYDKEWAIMDRERHLIYNIAWKKVPFLAGGVPIQRIAANTYRTFDKAIPGCKNLGSVEKTISGISASGFRYSYTVSDIHMMGEYLVLKHEKEYYSFQCLGRENSFEEYYPIFEKMLLSISFHSLGL